MGVEINMDTNAIITELRDWAEVQGAGTLANTLNEAADRLEELDERVAIMSEPHGWISVSDKLPEEDKEVLVARYMTKNGKKKPYVETASHIGGQWFSYTDEWKLNKTAHSDPFTWMPLPEPPKEEHDEP